MRKMNSKGNLNSLHSWMKILVDKLGWRENRGSRSQARRKFVLTRPFRLSENVGNALFICQCFFFLSTLKNKKKNVHYI